ARLGHVDIAAATRPTRQWVPQWPTTVSAWVQCLGRSAAGYSVGQAKALCPRRGRRLDRWFDDGASRSARGTGLGQDGLGSSRLAGSEVVALAGRAQLTVLRRFSHLSPQRAGRVGAEHREVNREER